MNPLKKLIPFMYLVLISILYTACVKEAAQENEEVTSIIKSDSIFSKKRGAGPRYWIAYEYCWINNSPILESVWKENIDWVAKNFKSYGYNMVSNDGWIEGAQTINSEGYITKYNDSWVYGFSYWADYLSSKDMEMGVYYNPMWLTKAAYAQNVSVLGTKFKARDIVGETSFNEPLYWVDVAKPGAKEWIQGYVNYFIKMGVTFLRIDFLENYERNYGTEKYEQTLKWIKEAAGDKISLSLVMPNCFNHGKTELPYGDMIRIDDDCFDGGWEFVSGRKRGQKQDKWPQYGNAFDGFIAFADIGGREQMILDGDFIRLNTLASDIERKSQVSLFVMAGSPIAIADQYNTIGNHAWVYQNNELLDLNDQGFVGKPLSYDINDAENSSRWAGQLPDGSWVIGLFNRETTTEIRSIDFINELGISEGTSNKVRDLWLHSDVEEDLNVYSVQLAPRDCKIIKIENKDVPKYEAEVASMIGGAKKNTNNLNFSGFGFADRLENVGAKVLFAVSVPTKGTYSLNSRYANANGSDRTASLYINKKKLPEKLRMPNLEDWNTWGTASNSVLLEPGVNFIAIQIDAEDNGSFNLDYIQIQELEKN